MRHALCEQHRMPERLAAFISTAIYGGMLRSASRVSRDPAAVAWIDVPGGRLLGGAGAGARGSLSNVGEANRVCKLMKELDARHPPPKGEGALRDRVVITAYLAQVRTPGLLLDP